MKARRAATAEAPHRLAATTSDLSTHVPRFDRKSVPSPKCAAGIQTRGLDPVTLLWFTRLPSVDTLERGPLGRSH